MEESQALKEKRGVYVGWGGVLAEEESGRIDFGVSLMWKTVLKRCEIVSLKCIQPFKVNFIRKEGKEKRREEWRRQERREKRKKKGKRKEKRKGEEKGRKIFVHF